MCCCYRLFVQLEIDLATSCVLKCPFGSEEIPRRIDESRRKVRVNSQLKNDNNSFDDFFHLPMF